MILCPTKVYMSLWNRSYNIPKNLQLVELHNDGRTNAHELNDIWKWVLLMDLNGALFISHSSEKQKVDGVVGSNHDLIQKKQIP